MVLAEPAQLEPWARCPWDATEINGEGERAGSCRRRGKGGRKEVLGGSRGTGRVPAVREVMLLTGLQAGEQPGPSCHLGVSPKGGTAGGDKSLQTAQGTNPSGL